MKFNLLNTFFPISDIMDYLDYFKEGRKVRSVLEEFFKNESGDLQNKFLENFDYPSDMTEPPVRYYNKEGIIYFVLNFKNDEVWNNAGSKEMAYVNALKILDAQLPIGVTDNIEPLENLEVDESKCIICTFKVNRGEDEIKKELLKTFGKMLILPSILVMILFTIKFIF